MAAVVAKVKKTHLKKMNFIDVLVSDASEEKFISDQGAVFIPTSIFYDKFGKLATKRVGVIDKKQLNDYLTGLEK